VREQVDVRYPSRMSRWPGVLVACALLACAEEKRAEWFDATKYRVEPRREAIERGASPKIELCDIVEEECQESVFEAAMNAYGAEGSRPRTRVVSDEEFVAFGDAMSSPEAQAEFEEAFADFLRSLSLLALISPELTVDSFTGEASADGIAAAYFFGPKEVLVIDRGMDTDGEFSVYVLAHEYTHALQDATYDLTKLHTRVRTTDQQHGLLGLVEGEAETYASLTVYREVQDSVERWRTIRESFVEGSRDDFAPFFAADVSFPYLIGNEFVTFTWLDGGNQAVADLYGAVPRSSREVLAGAGAEPPPGGWVESVSDTADGNVPAGYEPVFADSFGAWIFHVFLELMAAAKAEAAGDDAPDVRLPEKSVAANLRGDHVVAFAGDAAMVVVWRLRFEPEVSPDDVIAEIQAGAPDHFRLREEGGDVLLFAGEPAEALDAFADAFALPESEGGTAQSRAPAARRTTWPTPNRPMDRPRE
jgi:hypothetical protein